MDPIQELLATVRSQSDQNFAFYEDKLRGIYQCLPALPQRQIRPGRHPSPTSEDDDGESQHARRLVLHANCGHRQGGEKMIRFLLVPVLLALGLFTAPIASAQVLECQVQGVLVIVALDSPVTVCSLDTSATDSNTANIPILPINPHYGNN